MADSHQRVSRQGWGSRIGDSIKGLLFGAVLFIVAFPILWMNEGRSVRRYKALNEGQGVTISVKSESIDPANESKLIHTTGKAVTDETLTDPDFNISGSFLRMRRKVEMYQWVEEKETKKEKKLGGSEETVTTYTYKKEWRDSLVDSSEFDEPQGHQNPSFMACDEVEYQVSSAKLGAFQLTQDQISRISNFTAKALSADTEIPFALAEKTAIVGNSFYISVTPLVMEETQADGTVKTKKIVPTTPQIGDAKVTFETVANNQDISLMYQQIGDTFAPYQTKNGTIAELRTGIHSQEEMYESARSANAMTTWLLRLLGLVVMFIGLSMLFRPLSVLADVVPFIGNIVGVGTGVISFMIALGLSLLTIAVAWLFYRPLLSIVLMALIVGVIVLIIKKLRA